MSDTKTTCPVCGAPVIQHSADEGTQSMSYDKEEIQRLQKELDKADFNLRCLKDLYDGLDAALKTERAELTTIKQAIKDVKAVYKNDKVPAAFENRMNELFELVEE